MSPQAGVVLMQEIAPRLRSAIPQCVNKVGAEDDEEIFQDGLCMAAKLMDGLEKRGKQVTPGNVAYYTLLHLKSGRRSYSTGHTDVMGSATQIAHNSMVLSMEEEVGCGTWKWENPSVWKNCSPIHMMIRQWQRLATWIGRSSWMNMTHGTCASSMTWGAAGQCWTRPRAAGWRTTTCGSCGICWWMICWSGWGQMP